METPYFTNTRINDDTGFIMSSAWRGIATVAYFPGGPSWSLLMIY